MNCNILVCKTILESTKLGMGHLVGQIFKVAVRIIYKKELKIIQITSIFNISNNSKIMEINPFFPCFLSIYPGIL